MRTRQLSGFIGKFEKVFNIAFALYCILYLSGVLDRLGLRVYGTSYDASVVALILVTTFLKIPAHKNAPLDKLPWYDLCFIILSIVGTTNIIIYAPKIAANTRFINNIDIILGIITFVLLVEGIRRCIGWLLTVTAVLFFVYPLVAEFFPGWLSRPSMSLERVMHVQYFMPSGMFSNVTHLMATLIIAFVIFGSFLLNSKASDSFMNLALALTARYKGGPAKASVIGSALFGMVNGSTMANVATVGTITIPLMMRIGYNPTFAAAIEAVASNAGPLTPPVMGATVFIMCGLLSMEYWQAIIIAATPAFLYYLGLFIMIHQEAVRLGLKGLPKEEIPPLGRALIESWFFLVPFTVMLILLVGLHYSAATSAIAAILAIVIFSNLTKRTRMGPKKWLDALGGITQGLPQVGTSIVVAGVLDGSFQLTGVGLVLAQKLVELAGGSTVILTFLVAIALFILGLGLSVVACYLLAVVLLVPAMIMMGVHPLAAHFFVIWMAQAALITPPVCQPAFFAAGIAGAPLMAAGWQACRLGIVVYLVPIFWVFDPALLLVGSWDHILMAVFSTIVGIVYLSCGISGLMLTKSPWWERILVIVGGVCLLVPVIFMKLIGLALVAIPTIRQASLYLVEKRMARTARITQSLV